MIGPLLDGPVVSQSDVPNRIMLHEVLASKMVILKQRSRTGKLVRAWTSG